MAANCRVWLELCRTVGLLVPATGTARDEEYQQHCFENGTVATPVPSLYGEQAGLVLDFCQNVKGRECSDSTFFQQTEKLREWAGFERGGRWKSLPDRPHLQWSNGGEYTNSVIRAGDHLPAMPPY